MQPNVTVWTNLFLVRELTYKILKFSGGEIQVRMDELDHYTKRDVTGANLILETNIISSDILMEVLLLTDALRRMDLNFKISLKTKYFPYARQDRVCYSGESLSLKVVCDIINSQNYENVTIWDAHSDVTPALLNNVRNIPCNRYVREALSSFVNNPILVSPDAGAAKKVSSCAKEFSLPMVVAEKVRDTNTGAILRTVVDIPFEDVEKRDFLIVDDICDGGRTFIELSKVLREQHGIEGVICLYVTHGIFSAGFDELTKHIDHIYTPNPLRYDLPYSVTTL